MRLSAIILLFFTCLFCHGQAQPDSLAGINSVYDERNPVLSPDGNTLFFTRAGHPDNIDGVRDPGDIWISVRQPRGWSEPVHAGRVLNNRAYNAVAGFAPDGSAVFLHGHYTGTSAPARTQGIAVARRTGTDWSRPENISIPYFLNRSHLVTGALSDDNAVFVFSAESYGGHGVEDLYVTLKRDGAWEEPQNLGRKINTQFQELSPWLSADKRTLYFSSNGRKGSGSFDIYRAERAGESWQEWSEPENLGPAFNTSGRDLYYRYYEDLHLALYTTTTSSEGYGDVRVYAPSDPAPLLLTDSSAFAAAARREIAPPPARPAPPEESVPEEHFRVYGQITDSRTGEGIAARIAFEGPDQRSHLAQANVEGYAITLPSTSYTLRIQAPGYISALEKLESERLDLREVEMNFVLQPVAVGATVNLKNVLFAQSKTDILPESHAELDLVVSFMQDNPNVRIELMGHTDGRGVAADNVRLSQQRVDKVKDYLVSKGIDEKRITGKGYGGTRPIASNDSEESRRLNRRVEFVIRRM